VEQLVITVAIAIAIVAAALRRQARALELVEQRTMQMRELNLRLLEANADLAAARAAADLAARVDPLTGLRNRRHFDETLAAELARAGRAGSGLGVLLVDVDELKNANDRLGHQAGDQLLIELGRRITGTVRGYDTVTRWGGDEFAVLVPGLEADEDLDAVVETLDHAIRGRPCSLAGKSVAVSASIGAVRVTNRGWSADQAVAAADRALYDAKRAANAQSPLSSEP